MSPLPLYISRSQSFEGTVGNPTNLENHPRMEVTIPTDEQTQESQNEVEPKEINLSRFRFECIFQLLIIQSHLQH